MTQYTTREQNRFWIAVNYSSLIAALIIFYTGRQTHWPLSLIILAVGALAFFAFSFIRAFLKTGFWKMVHTSDKNLDEREIQRVLTSLRYAYAAFTIICLVIIYAFAIAEYHPIDVVLAGALLYLAHTLPATLVGWTEQIMDGDPTD